MHNWCQLPQLEVQGIKKMRTRLSTFLKPDEERLKYFMSSPRHLWSMELSYFIFSGKNSVCIIWRKSLGMQLTSRCGGLRRCYPWVMLCAQLLLHILVFGCIRKGAKSSRSVLQTQWHAYKRYSYFSYMKIYFKSKSFKPEITSTCELELPGGGSLMTKPGTLSLWWTPSPEIGANS